MNKPDLRKAALERLDAEWQAAIEQAEELENTLGRLSKALSSCDEMGGTMTIEFQRPLAQKWWVVYQEAGGAMIVRQPEDVPSMMDHEDDLLRSAEARALSSLA